jgi:dephospho-CoA kinase
MKIITDNNMPDYDYPKITFLTGCSGAGKSTIVQALQHQINEEQVAFLHFDSIGVPTLEEMIRDYGEPSKWQEQMTYNWIEIITNKYLHYQQVIIEGQVNIDYILRAFKKFNITNAQILLIHAGDKVRHERLKINRNQPELVNEQMDSWARFLFDQAKRYNIEIIDTSIASLDKIILAIKAILK